MARYYSYGAGRIIPVPGGIRTVAFPRRFLKNVEIMTETYCGTKQNRSNHRLQKDLTKAVGVSWKHFGEHPW
jgi:hypothetical protein